MFRIANRHRLVSFHRNTEVTLAKRWDICQDGRGDVTRYVELLYGKKRNRKMAYMAVTASFQPIFFPSS